MRSLPVESVSSRNVGDNGTLLQAAIQRDKLDFVRILLDYGVDPTAVSEVNPRAPLEIAMECPQHLKSLPILAKFMEMVSTKRPQQGGSGTILQDAVQNGKLHFVSDLLSFGVDPTAVCEEKKDTPMEISVASEKSSPEMRRSFGKIHRYAEQHQAFPLVNFD